MHPEHPLERLCTHRDETFQWGFARQALQILPPREDSTAEATPKGLVLRAETESALERQIKFLTEVYGARLRIGHATVRYQHTPRREEPHMGVRVQCASRYFPAVKADLLARHATVLDEEMATHHGTLRVTAPLSHLLGYERALRELTDDNARAVVWFNGYVPSGKLPSDRPSA